MKKTIMRMMSLLLFCVMVFSCVMIVREKLRAQRERDEFNELAAIVTGQITESAQEETTEPDVSESIDDIDKTEEIAQESEPEPIFKRNLQPIFEKNSDCIGWIFIEGTRVDYPVMFTPNEEQKYLRKSFSGEYSISGTPFLNDNGGIDFDHLIIYGHNMKNGTMFSDLEEYLNVDFYNEHSVIEFETAKGLKLYEVFAVVQLKKTDDWYAFTNADNDVVYNGIVGDIKARSSIETDVIPKAGQQILTLSTCYGPSDDDRLIVVAAEMSR